MKRIIGGALLVGALSGCVNVENSPENGGQRPNYGRSWGGPTVPGVSGPYGTPVQMAAPYNMNPPGSQWAAANMMNQSIPLNNVQMSPPGMPLSGPPGGNMPPTMMPGNMLSPPGLPPMPGAAPGGMLQQAGGMMGALPDSGVVRANVPPGANMAGGVVPAQFANSSPVGSLFPAQRTQVQFAKPGGMKVYWFTQGADGKPSYSDTPLETPGRYNFAQSAIYRLKLTRIPGRPALELYPTLEVVPTSPKTNEFLAHNSVPIEFSDEDFKQVVDRNYIVKVIYLPDPQFQDAAGAGPDEISSARLEPGQDPIQEALRRGSILLVLRIGNIDQGLTASPGLTAPVPGGAPMNRPPFMGVPPGFQVPNGGAPILPPGGGGFNMAPPGGGFNAPPPGVLPLVPGPNPSLPPLVRPETSEAVRPPLTLPVPPALQTPGPAPVLTLPPPLVVPNKTESDKPAAPNGGSGVTTSKGATIPQPPLINLPPIPLISLTTEETKGSVPVTPAGTAQPSVPTTPAGNPPMPTLPSVPTVNPNAGNQPALPPVPTVPESN